MRDHTILIAFVLADEMALLTYMVTKFFPKEEIYNLTSQIRRAVDSIALNISEGSIGQSNQEFGQTSDFRLPTSDYNFII